ncbi:MAG: RNA pseudouridine synthase [Idiomarina sp.]|nr:RNA pseudouridine synthase [Idiomarina sp.]
MARLPHEHAHPLPTPSRATDDFVYDPPQHPYLNLVYYDSHIVVANKPSGLLSVPGKAPAHQDSLERRLARVWPQIRVVHRLDMATSGLILFALHKGAQSALGKQFQARTVEKCYIARVAGQLPTEHGEVNLPLRCDWPNRPKQMVCQDEGKASLTRYQVAQYDPLTHHSDVRLYPYTGRSHQLRVHMDAIGCPILGDRLYGTQASQQAASRLLLHAHWLSFTHPVTETPLEFTLQAPF